MHNLFWYPFTALTGLWTLRVGLYSIAELFDHYDSQFSSIVVDGDYPMTDADVEPRLLRRVFWLVTLPDGTFTKVIQDPSEDAFEAKTASATTTTGVGEITESTPQPRNSNVTEVDSSDQDTPKFAVDTPDLHAGEVSRDHVIPFPETGPADDAELGLEELFNEDSKSDIVDGPAIMSSDDDDLGLVNLFGS